MNRSVICMVPGCDRQTTKGQKGFRKLCDQHLRWRKIRRTPLVRSECTFPGCSNLAVLGSRDRNKKFCKTHRYIKKYSRRHKEDLAKRQFPAKKCVLCGWEGPCDRHRMVLGRDGGRYVEGNVAILCPNCHRLLHRGIINNGHLDPLKEE